jgi:hypothetical protein
MIESASPKTDNLSRRSFIGGSDARIIMGSDEAALMRLWREKRGEAEPEDLSGKSTQPRLVRAQHWPARHSCAEAGEALGHSLDDGDTGRHRRGN